MSNPLKKIQDHIHDRFENPTIGTFSFFMIIFNWRYFVTIFTGSIQPYERITGVENLWNQNGITLFYPFILTICYPMIVALSDWLIFVLNTYRGIDFQRK